MLQIYRRGSTGCVAGENRLVPVALDAQDAQDAQDALAPGALWLDLLEPTREEERRVEAHLALSVPTREDMADIEPSELLYTENGARYLTVQLVAHADTDEPVVTGVTFILKDDTLVTVRYDRPKVFDMFVHRAARPGGCGDSAEALLSDLFDTVVDRAAEVIQATGKRVDQVSRIVFETDAGSQRRKRAGIKRRPDAYQRTLKALGRQADLLSKTRESLVSVERALLFLSASYRARSVPMDLREQVRVTLRDLQSLEEQTSFQSSKIQFLLDATLGLVTIEQNNIIKLFSVMAVIFMPPTLVASIYGMNFKHMPELDWELGYPMALALMLAVAVAPYVLFRWKRWL